MIGIVFSLAVASAVGGALLGLREYVRIADRLVLLETRLAASEARSFETDAVAASLCCQVQDLEQELTVVAHMLFDDSDKGSATERPN